MQDFTWTKQFEPGRGSKKKTKAKSLSTHAKKLQIFKEKKQAPRDIMYQQIVHKIKQSKDPCHPWFKTKYQLKQKTCKSWRNFAKFTKGHLSREPLKAPVLSSAAGITPNGITKNSTTSQVQLVWLLPGQAAYACIWLESPLESTLNFSKPPSIRQIHLW